MQHVSKEEVSENDASAQPAVTRDESEDADTLGVEDSFSADVDR